jgi:5-methylcytosine-specific restriction endonuclease McrA
MAHKAIPLETRSCKGCGVEFQTTDPRKWFHKSGCGRAKVVKQTNAWLLVNRPNYPTEPCRTCGAPVVQYRTRRYDGQMRYCQRTCQPHTGLGLLEAPQWPPKTYGPSSSLKRGCNECDTGLRLSLCNDHYQRRWVLRQQIWTRLRWLMPRSCSQCNQAYKAWGPIGRLCDACKSHNKSAMRKWSRIKRKHRLSGGATKISPARLYQRDNRICALCHKVTDHPRVWKEWIEHRRWMPNAPTVDHIIPLAKGGTHTWDNVQLAHMHCNVAKSDTLVPTAPKIIKTRLRTVPSDEFVDLLYGVEPA